MDYFLGIDGGGTKTMFVLGDFAHLIATETAAGSNVAVSYTHLTLPTICSV